MAVGIKEILNFAEAQLLTVANLDKVAVIGSDDQQTGVRRYGAFLYLGEDTEQYENEYRGIGSILTETWTVNLDIIINVANKKSKKYHTGSLGSDHWIKTIRELFLHKKNNGQFEDMYYTNLKVLDNDNGIRITGLLTCEVENIYPC